MQKAVLQADRSNINILPADVLILLKQEPAVQTVLGAIGIKAALLLSNAAAILPKPAKFAEPEHAPAIQARGNGRLGGLV